MIQKKNPPQFCENRRLLTEMLLLYEKQKFEFSFLMIGLEFINSNT